MGRSRYPEARELFITADAGGSNGYRLRAWKQGLQQFADEASARWLDEIIAGTLIALT